MRKLLVFLSIISMLFGNNSNLCNPNISSGLLCKNNVNEVEENDVVQHAPSNSNYLIELDIKNTPYTDGVKSDHIKSDYHTLIELTIEIKNEKIVIYYAGGCQDMFPGDSRSIYE